MATAEGSSRRASGKNRKSNSGGHAPLISDPRFARLHTDPRFLRPNRDDAKIALDDRFTGLIDGQGGRKGKDGKRPIDRYGRKQSGNQRDETDDLKRLYRAEAQGVEGDASSSDEATPSRGAIDYARGEGQLESSGDDDSSDESESEAGSEEVSETEHDVLIGSAAARRREKKRASDGESDVAGDVEDTALDGVSARQLAELDARAERAVKLESSQAAKSRKHQKPAFGGDTARLAVVNMDWDHIRAVDLYKVFNSLVSVASSSNSNPKGRALPTSAPAGAACHSVRVYPSEFGRKRMAKENQEGPPREIFKTEDSGDAQARARAAKRASKAAQRRSGSGADRGDEAGRDQSDEDDSEEEIFDIDEGGDFDEEALRAYQLDRLRYYYAIATFDSPETARFILNEIDGTEMEHTANTFDISFVPIDMTFPDHQGDSDDPSDDGWRDEANLANTDGKYEGVDFTTDALRHSRVKLTWDADDPQRSKVTRQLMAQAPTADQLRDEDFKAYLASASEDSASEESEEEAEGGQRSERMRALLGLGADEADQGHAGFGKAKSRAFQDGRKTAGKGEVEGDMEITFMPGLSEAAARKKEGKGVQGEESTIEKYKRKQREKRERRQKGEEAINAAPLDDGDAAANGFDDPFFGGSEEEDIDFDVALAAEKKASKARGKPAAFPQDDASDDETVESDRLAGLGEDDDVGHFSLKDIIKAEQAATDGKKKSRWAKKKEKKQAQLRDARNGHEVQPDFQMDVGDKRFSTGLFDDHRFALDPSHPNFYKTKGMQQLVEARRKRQRDAGQDKVRPKDRPVMENGGGDEMADLVRSVKKRVGGKNDQRNQSMKSDSTRLSAHATR